MGSNINRELTMARALTRSERKHSVTPLGCRDRRLVHRPYRADSLDGKGASSLLRVAPPFVVIGDVILLAELKTGHPEALGLGDGLLFRPLIVQDSVNGDDHARAVGPALAMDEDRPILPVVNDCQGALH